MNGREFVRFFIAGLLGGLIYKLLVYFSGPSDANWVNMVIEITLIATVIAAVIMLFKRWGEQGTKGES